VETFEEVAEELEVLQALNVLLGQCLSTRMRNAMVRYEQLPEWRKKRLSRLPDPYTADSVPNSQKLNEKKRFLKVLEERGVSKKSVMADLPLLFLDSRGVCRATWLKLVPFVLSLIHI